MACRRSCRAWSAVVWAAARGAGADCAESAETARKVQKRREKPGRGIRISRYCGTDGGGNQGSNEGSGVRGQGLGGDEAVVEALEVFEAAEVDGDRAAVGGGRLEFDTGAKSAGELQLGFAFIGVAGGSGSSGGQRGLQFCQVLFDAAGGPGLFDDLQRQFALVLGVEGQQGAGVAGGELALAEHFDHLRVEAEEAEEVGDGGAVFAGALGD